MPLLEDRRLVRREKRVQVMKKTFVSLLFKAIAKFLHRERTGRREKGTLTKLSKTSVGLWRGTAVKLRGPHGHQPTRTMGKQPGVELCISTKPAQEHLTGISEQILILFQQRDRRHIRRKYIPLNILK